MPRKFKSPDRFIQPDPRFSHVLLAKFINCLMLDGKKLVAQRVVYRAFEDIERRLKKDPLDVFLAAIHNVKPMVEVKSRRVGGSNYQVPVEVNRKRQTALAFRWVLDAARGKRGRPMHLRLADELIAAHRREGAAVTKRENVHKMAEANKAFAHFAF
jgi:small subunit ribosomal protein S7